MIGGYSPNVSAKLAIESTPQSERQRQIKRQSRKGRTKEFHKQKYHSSSWSLEMENILQPDRPVKDARLTIPTSAQIYRGLWEMVAALTRPIHGIISQSAQVN
jgi:hypothetical protein